MVACRVAPEDFMELTRPSVIGVFLSSPALSSPPSGTLHMLLLFLEAPLLCLCLHPSGASGISLIVSFPGKPCPGPCDKSGSPERVTGSTLHVVSVHLTILMICFGACFL